MQINLVKTVAARPPVVFATVADIVKWPQIIRSIKSVELLTQGPVRVGTRFRARRVMFGQETTQEMEIVELERPRRLRLVGENPHMHYELDHVIDALGTGSRMLLIFRSKPERPAGKAVLPFIAPFLEINLRDELEQDLADLAAAISAKAPA